MAFKIPEFKYPDFNDKRYKNIPDIKTEKVEKDGVLPDNFFLTKQIPTFYKYNGRYILPEKSSLNCVAVLEDKKIIVKELMEVEKGNLVVTGEDEKDGIILYPEGFDEEVYTLCGTSAETSYSDSYEKLFELMRYERKSGGYIVWVLGPSVVFDFDTRNALDYLAKKGYINCLLGGNAMCTHDLEGGYLNTALGQNIYTQENVPLGHYNHLDLLNEVRKTGSVKDFIKSGKVKDGIIKTLVEMDVPIVLSGSIRDDGPLPEVMANQDEAMLETKSQLEKATLVITMATMLHSVSAANLAPIYKTLENKKIRPVYFCSVDITENAVNKVRAARENTAFIPIVTNVQDFAVNCKNAL